MEELFKTKIGRLRILGTLEGLSFLFLLCVAMPEKYLYGNPILVRITGPIHGILFIMFVMSIFNLSSEYKWNFKEITSKLLIASVIPFGPFYIDKKILSKIS